MQKIINILHSQTPLRISTKRNFNTKSSFKLSFSLLCSCLALHIYETYTLALQLQTIRKLYSDFISLVSLLRGYSCCVHVAVAQKFPLQKTIFMFFSGFSF